MPSTVSCETLQQTVDEVAKCHGNKSEAARKLGVKVSTLKHRYAAGLTAGLTPLVVEPTNHSGLVTTIETLRSELVKVRLELEEAHASLRISRKPHFTIRQNIGQPAEKIRVVCIGDAHDSPGIPDKSRFRWIGQYIGQIKPDMVIQIGDFGTFDSLNSHATNDTLDGRLKPSFENDLGSFNLALQEMGDLTGIERHVTLGNHERRIWAYENAHPEMEGNLGCSLESILRNNGWTYSPYGMPHMVGGVGFVHACLNSLAKTYGGKNAENTIANDAIHDWVIGHSHRDRMHKAPKLGANNFVKILNVGCALPDQHIEEYAQHSLTGWSYGIVDMIISGGHIRDHNFISMAQLGEKYGG